ncbi:MAG TPA: hypothetical protein VEZ55_06960 [Chitinophagaceae bacterium]|nr:hypothetical protein [Chitinophagaceae bacterium]
MKEILQKVPDVVTEKAIQFDITILPKNKFHGQLQKYRLAPTKQSFSIRPLVLGTLYRISKLLLKIDVNGFQESGTLSLAYQLMKEHSSTVINIIGLAITNSKQLPDKKLLELIRFNLSSDECVTVLSFVLKQMEVTSFIQSIISIRGLDLITPKEMNPQTQGSTVAPGAPSVLS